MTSTEEQLIELKRRLDQAEEESRQRQLAMAEKEEEIRELVARLALHANKKEKNNEEHFFEKNMEKGGSSKIGNSPVVSAEDIKLMIAGDIKRFSSVYVSTHPRIP